MAEQQRLRSQNFTTRVPRVDFTAQQVQARGLSELSANLDRLSNFFLQQAEQKAKIEGAEYGALNAPTRQQLEDARNDGTDIELVGDKTTVFGRAARQVALETAENEITYLAKREISSIVVKAKQLNASPAALGDAIDTAIAGYGSALDETEPALARAFRAKVGIYGNAEYETYTKQFLTDAKAQRRAQFAAGVDLELDGLGALFSAGTPQGDDGEAVDLSEILKVTKRNLLNEAVNKHFYSQAQTEALADRFDKAVQDAARGQITATVIEADNPYVAFLFIKSNNKGIDAGTRAALDILTPENRKLAIQEARQAWHDTIQDEMTRREIAQKIEEDEIKELEQNINAALFLAKGQPERSISQFKLFVNRLAQIDAKKANEYSEMLQTDGKGFAFSLKSKDSTIFLLDARMMDLDNPITLSDLDAHLRAGDLSYDDWKSYAVVARERMGERFNAAVKDIRLRLELPMAQFNTSLVSTWKINTMNKVERAMREARRASVDPRGFDPMEWLDKNYDEIAGQEKDNGNKSDLAQLVGKTRASVERLLNRATTQTDKDHYQNLLNIADRLIADGVDVPGFMQ